jgi:hypothetical protein
MVGMTSCPTLPKFTEIILEIAGLTNARPEMVRYTNKVSPGVTVNAANPPTSGSESAIALSSLTPLAFISAQTDNRQAVATQLYDSNADSLFYAVISKENTIRQPDTLDLIYDHLPWMNQKFLRGQHLGDISLPLVVLNSDGTERQVPTTLHIRAVCTGGPECVSASVTGDFLGKGTTQTCGAAELGLSFAIEFGASPISSDRHAIITVQVPLLVTHANDPPYFVPNFDTLRSTFVVDGLGFTPVFLGRPIGASPVAAPFPASFSKNSDGDEAAANPLPAIAPYLVISADGDALASAPLPQPPQP